MDVGDIDKGCSVFESLLNFCFGLFGLFITESVDYLQMKFYSNIFFTIVKLAKVTCLVTAQDKIQKPTLLLPMGFSYYINGTASAIFILL